MEPKTVFLATDHGFSSRYLLRTEIFTTLKKSGLRLVILSPDADEEYFRNEFKDENIHLEKYEAQKILDYLNRSRLYRLFRTLRNSTAKASADLGTFRARRKRFWRKSKPSERMLNALLELPVPFLRRSQVMRKALIWIESALYTPNFHKELFDRYRPQLIVVTGIGNMRSTDAVLMREAKRHGVVIASIILSWDNTSTRGIGAADPDYIIAWTETMKRELVEYYDIQSDRIFVGGVAHWDHYYLPPEMSREELYQKYGLDPSRKLILFGTASPIGWADLNLQVIEVIGQAIRESRFVYPCQLLVRIHPYYYHRQRREIIKDYRVRLESLVQRYHNVTLAPPVMNKSAFTFDLAPDDASNLKCLLNYSDVLVTSYSTLMLEASILNRPTVNVAFQSYSERMGQPYSAVTQYPHIKRILETGGTRSAYHAHELIDLINMYLEKPDLDKEGRAAMHENECGPWKGMAGRTTGKYLLSLLGDGALGSLIGHQGPYKPQLNSGG